MQEGVFMLGIWIVIFSFFAAYGIVQMIVKGVYLSRTEKGKPPDCMHRVVGLKDAEDSVEGLLRSLTWVDATEDIIIIDYGSTDETGEILRRLCMQYPCLRVVKPEEYIAYMESLKEI